MIPRVLAAITHAALLVAPAIALGRIDAASRPRAVAIVVVLLVLAARESRFVDRGRSRLALASSIALLATAWLAIAHEGTSTVFPWLGLVPAIAGIALRVLAIQTLGPGFSSAIEPGPVLVVRGIYGHVRHPSDLGLFLLAAGLAILGESLPAGVATLGLGLTISVRIGREEAALSERFRGDHANYRERVRSLVPSLRGRMATSPPRC